MVQSRRLPDGLLEVRKAGNDEHDLYVVEISTYPYVRLVEQVLDDIASVLLDRRVLPEVIALFLCPRGNVEPAHEVELESRQKLTKLRLTWKTITLWTIPAESLLAVGDVGLIPWVPLALVAGQPEPIFRECRARIDRDAPPDERENLLAVTQFLARLRYNDEGLFGLFGGRKAMIESPLLQELKEEWTRAAMLQATRETARKDIVKILEARFGIAARSLEDAVGSLDESRLDEVLRLAATSRSIASFRKRLGS